MTPVFCASESNKHKGNSTIVIILSMLCLLFGFTSCAMESADDVPSGMGPTASLDHGNPSALDPNLDVQPDGEYYEWPDGGYLYKDPNNLWFYIDPTDEWHYIGVDEPNTNSIPDILAEMGQQTATTPPPAPSPTATRNEAQAILDQCLPGEIAFRPPSPMRMGETREFVVRAVMSGSTVDPKESFPEDAIEGQSSKPVETANPQICDSMRAELSGPAFDVKRAGSESGKMLVPEQGMAEWRWHITPKKTGTQRLTLQLYAVGPDGDDIPLKTYEEDILVDVTLGYATRSFVKEWVIPLGVTIPVAIGGIAVAVRWWRKWRNAKECTRPIPPRGRKFRHR